MIMQVKPATGTPTPCKVCGAPSPLHGVVDFNKACIDQNDQVLPLAGLPIYYRRCQNCDFMFTDAFDDWGQDDYKNYIYNDDYLKVDPDYIERRPTGNAQLIARLFAQDGKALSVLDYGGGNGKFSQTLTQAGFSDASTYDPFTPEHAILPRRKFDIVTCMETLEHVPDPKSIIRHLADLTAGIVFFSTLLQPDTLTHHRMNWWYLAPRNGHISLYSKKSMTHLWNEVGFQWGTFNNQLLCAFRELPDFIRRRMK
ncbi:MAG TPA: class I SAM-dependent methyltransferase [Stellaceae bacterium]|nr:class I SAM-dependent methyltransferase [Stellaceae bacterium]